VRIALLGPLEVTDDDGRTIPIAGARLRALLIRLALAPAVPWESKL
jgi:DNA-binding SARP family transcriptional activator